MLMARFLPNTKFLFLSCTLASVCALPASGQIFVRQGAAPGGDGTSWLHAYSTLQNALQDPRVVTEQAAIWVAQGEYKPGFQRTSTFLLPDRAEMYGGFLGIEENFQERPNPVAPTVLSGDIDGIPGVSAGDCYHVVTVAASSSNDILAFDGFTIQSGCANGHTFPDSHGGGMLVYGGNSGGGVFFAGFRNNLFRGNHARVGGGLALHTNVIMPLAWTRWIGNSASEEGGGLWITGWNASAALGSMSNRAHNLEIDSNKAIRGGGVYIEAVTNFTEFYNCALTRNQATGQGGGLFVERAFNQLRIGHCTIAGNELLNIPYSKKCEGAGLFLGTGEVPQFQEYHLFNSVVWGNAMRISKGKLDDGLAGPGVSFDPMGDLEVRWCDISNKTLMPWPGLGNIYGAPLFVNPGSGDFRLRPPSPAIDAGNTSLIPNDWLDLDRDGNVGERLPIDLRYVPRLGTLGLPRTDMGCFELAEYIY